MSKGSAQFHLPHAPFFSTPEQPEPGTGRAIFPLRTAHLILAAVRPPLLRPMPPGPAGSSTSCPIPRKTPVSQSRISGLKGGNG